MRIRGRVEKSVGEWALGKMGLVDSWLVMGDGGTVSLSLFWIDTRVPFKK